MTDPKPATLVAPVYPAQRVIRTVLVDVVVWGPTLGIGVPVLVQAASLPGVLPAAVVAQVVAAGALATAISGALSRVIALPRINAWLTTLGAGTVPRRAAREQVVEIAKDTQDALDAIAAGKAARG